VQGITVDLWETLFLDSHYVSALNKMREKIIDDALNDQKSLLNMPTRDMIIAERQRFQSYEKMGEFLPFNERIGFITDYKLSTNEISCVAKKIDIVSATFYPKLKNELLIKLKQWKSKYKLALISNTGMTSSFVIKSILNMYGIYDLFDEIIFSEDVGFCKPNIDIFYLASKKLNIPVFNFLHIGDSLLFDFHAAQNAGFYAIKVEGNEYSKSW
jgi:FMN phosphatase YigB (HAD superfamily)